ncbi:HAD family hydrolase [Anaerobaca lacustris]|uniref:HAD family hydrolase n=1 Tax=Anaerobaca lacustris TaxID=3044600 RepID=A0AAW6TX16_9BACT|nr:HAD family hydrolase [Sedimentisphaerales bacterium M17dextr]
MDEIRAVLFDLGETLLTFGKVGTTKLILQGARSSYDFLRQEGQPIGSFAGYFLRYLVRLRLRYFLAEFRGKDFDSLALLQQVGRREGIDFSREQWEEVIWRWYEPLSRLAEIEPDLHETLANLTESGVRLGIVSNTFVNRASLDRQLAGLGLLDFFPMRLYSYELMLRKPDARLFRIAAERIGEAPERILFVGDRIDLDVRPALDCGMAAALKDAYTNRGKATPAGAHRIENVAELPALIERINSSATQPAST